MASVYEHTRRLRTGKAPINLSTLLRKVAEAPPSPEDALASAERLDALRQDRAYRYGAGALVGATTYPIAHALGEAAGAAAAPGSKGKRLRAAVVAGGKSLFSPETAAKNLVRGAVSGGGVQAVRESVSALPDQQRVDAFLAASRKTSSEIFRTLAKTSNLADLTHLATLASKATNAGVAPEKLRKVVSFAKQKEVPPEYGIYLFVDPTAEKSSGWKLALNLPGPGAVRLRPNTVGRFYGKAGLSSLQAPGRSPTVAGVIKPNKPVGAAMVGR